MYSNIVHILVRPKYGICNLHKKLLINRIIEIVRKTNNNTLKSEIFVFVFINIYVIIAKYVHQFN